MLPISTLRISAVRLTFDVFGRRVVRTRSKYTVRHLTGDLADEGTQLVSGHPGVGLLPFRHHVL